MTEFLDRVSQESGLILVVLIAATLLAMPVVAWRVRSGQRLVPAVWNTGLEAALLASFAGLLALTLGGYGTDGRGPVNLIPFQSLSDSFALGDFYVGVALYDLVLNFLLYLPLGLFAALRFHHLSLSAWVVVVVALSAAIEITQGLVLNRSADVTDVLTNALGGTFGFVLARVTQRLYSRLRRDSQRSA